MVTWSNRLRTSFAFPRFAGLCSPKYPTYSHSTPEDGAEKEPEPPRKKKAGGAEVVFSSMQLISLLARHGVAEVGGCSHRVRKGDPSRCRRRAPARPVGLALPAGNPCGMPRVTECVASSKAYPGHIRRLAFGGVVGVLSTPGLSGYEAGPPFFLFSAQWRSAWPSKRRVLRHFISPSYRRWELRAPLPATPHRRTDGLAPGNNVVDVSQEGLKTIVYSPSRSLQVHCRDPLLYRGSLFL